jgi:PAS domain S-box-containing protein
MPDDLSVDYLKQKDTALGLVLDSLFDGVYIVDRERRILFWNRGAEKLTGYASADVMDQRCSDDILNHIDEEGHLLCKGRCPLMRSINTGQEVRAKVYPLCKDGRRFPVETHVSPLRDRTGEIIGAVEVFRDVSSEEDFRVLQEKFNALVRRYVSKGTYAQILSQASGADTRVAIRDMTVFYLDIVGFTALSEQTTPGRAVKLLNDVFGMCGVITREKHGDIDKFIGDAIMAVFIDANDAVEAAETLLNKAFPCLNEQRREAGLDPVYVRIGINSGIVVQGDIGTTDRKDLTVIGDVVNTAQRIESITPPNSLRISETTYSRLNPENEKRFCFDRETTVKNRERPVNLFAPRLESE